MEDRKWKDRMNWKDRKWKVGKGKRAKRKERNTMYNMKKGFKPSDSLAHFLHENTSWSGYENHLELENQNVLL